MAVYGPFTKTVVRSGSMNGATISRQFYQTQRWYRQKPITAAPLQYDLGRYILRWWYMPSDDAANTSLAYSMQASSGPWISLIPQARQKCYEKFVGRVNDCASQWAENLAQKRQAADMIAGTAKRLRDAVKALRRGDMRRFYRELDVLHLIPKNRGRWSRPRDASNLWLQYHFGWEPLIQDIYNAVQFLDEEYWVQLVTAKAQVKGAWHIAPAPTQYGTWQHHWPELQARCLMQARVRVIDVNAHRAAAMGLVNPATLLWQLSPFSFLVDWLIPVEQYLNSWTDFHGLELDLAFTTQSQHADGESWVSYSQYPGWKANYVHPAGWRVTRTLGIPTPGSPTLKQFKGLSVSRAATAVSLLIGSLAPR